MKRLWATQSDYKFRAFLLRLLDGREMTIPEIRRTVARDAPWKKISYRRQIEILNTLANRRMLRKMRIKEKHGVGRCKYMYTVTEKGLERCKYYEKMIKELNL